MRLTHVRVQNYRYVRDTGWFTVECDKTILVGPNEAGKTAVLEALQQINPPDGAKEFDALRDYPRKLYNADIQSQKRDPGEIPVVSARFELEPDDVAKLPDGFPAPAEYGCTRHLDNELTHWLEGGLAFVVFSQEVRKDLICLAAHVDKRASEAEASTEQGLRADLEETIAGWQVGATKIDDDRAHELRHWLDSTLEFLDEHDAAQDQRHTRLTEYTRIPEQRALALTELHSRLVDRVNLGLSRVAFPTSDVVTAEDGE